MFYREVRAALEAGRAEVVHTTDSLGLKVTIAATGVLGFKAHFLTSIEKELLGEWKRREAVCQRMLELNSPRSGSMTTNVDVDSASDLSANDAERLVGQTVSRVEAWEYGFTLIFTDGSKVEVSGALYGGSALGVEFTASEPEQDR